MDDELNLDALAKLAEKYRLSKSMVHRQYSAPPYQVKHNGGKWHLVSVGDGIDGDPIGKIFDLDPDDADNLLDLLKAIPRLIELARIGAQEADDPEDIRKDWALHVLELIATHKEHDYVFFVADDNGELDYQPGCAENRIRAIAKHALARTDKRD